MAFYFSEDFDKVISFSWNISRYLESKIYLPWIQDLLFQSLVHTDYFRESDIIKGQSISKGYFRGFKFSEKTNYIETVSFCPSLLGAKKLVCFLGELKKPKSSIEINWPLSIKFLLTLNSVLTHFRFVWSKCSLSIFHILRQRWH